MLHVTVNQSAKELNIKIRMIDCGKNKRRGQMVMVRVEGTPLYKLKGDLIC
jgi:hypothetical protein